MSYSPHHPYRNLSPPSRRAYDARPVLRRGTRFRFGKYRGESVTAILYRNPDYFLWLDRNFCRVDGKTLESAKRILRDRAKDRAKVRKKPLFPSRTTKHNNEYNNRKDTIMSQYLKDYITLLILQNDVKPIIFNLVAKVGSVDHLETLKKTPSLRDLDTVLVRSKTDLSGNGLCLRVESENRYGIHLCQVVSETAVSFDDAIDYIQKHATLARYAIPVTDDVNELHAVKEHAQKHEVMLINIASARKLAKTKQRAKDYADLLGKPLLKKVLSGKPIVTRVQHGKAIDDGDVDDTDEFDDD